MFPCFCISGRKVPSLFQVLTIINNSHYFDGTKCTVLHITKATPKMQKESKKILVTADVQFLVTRLVQFNQLSSV